MNIETAERAKKIIDEIDFLEDSCTVLGRMIDKMQNKKEEVLMELGKAKAELEALND